MRGVAGLGQGGRQEQRREQRRRWAPGPKRDAKPTSCLACPWHAFQGVLLLWPPQGWLVVPSPAPGRSPCLDGGRQGVGEHWGQAGLAFLPTSPASGGGRVPAPPAVLPFSQPPLVPTELDQVPSLQLRDSLTSSPSHLLHRIFSISSSPFSSPGASHLPEPEGAILCGGRP